MRPFWSGAQAALLVAAVNGNALAQEPARAELETRAARLIAAYPEHLDRLDGDMLVWKDGTRMLFNDGIAAKTHADRISRSDLKDMFAEAYPMDADTAPPKDFDPGRYRNAAFFAKMYGDCSQGALIGKLPLVNWLPKHGGGQIAVTGLNGVAQRLAAISAELDELPERFMPFLVPSAGGFACRKIANARETSAHAYGIALDINAGRADYWQWPKLPKGDIIYRNRVPLEIVRIFEKHGFIWGGRWYHYDTMHFEYRPELLSKP